MHIFLTLSTYTLISFLGVHKKLVLLGREREAERRERVKILTCLKKVFFKKEFLPSLSSTLPAVGCVVRGVVVKLLLAARQNIGVIQASTGKSESESEVGGGKCQKRLMS